MGSASSKTKQNNQVTSLRYHGSDTSTSSPSEFFLTNPSPATRSKLLKFLQLTENSLSTIYEAPNDLEISIIY